MTEEPEAILTQKFSVNGRSVTTLIVPCAFIIIYDPVQAASGLTVHKVNDKGQFIRSVERAQSLAERISGYCPGSGGGVFGTFSVKLDVARGVTAEM